MQLSPRQLTKIDYQMEMEGNKSIVMINALGDKEVSPNEKTSNIYCIDKCNNIIWQVKEFDTEAPFDNDAFIHMKMNEAGEIIAYRFSGLYYKVDPETGRAEQLGFKK